MTKIEMLKIMGLTNYYNDPIQQKIAIKNAMKKSKELIGLALCNWYTHPTPATKEFNARVLCEIAKFNCAVNEIKESD